MSRWSDDPADIDRRIARGLIVAEYGPGDVSAIEYIRRAKR